jgi:hypothetical protein
MKACSLGYIYRMKKLFFLIFVPFLAQANFSKPELVARLNVMGAWNAPGNMWCFTGEPAIMKGNIYINCLDESGQLMAQWSKTGFKIIARAQGEQVFSVPTFAFNKVSWSESDELEVKRFFESTGTYARKIEITNHGPSAESNDSFRPQTANTYFFRTAGAAPELWTWKQNQVTPFYNPQAAYLFTTQVGSKGEIAFKVRFKDVSEESPDKIMLFTDGAWKVVLEDRDANPKSRWKSFRHQLTVEGNKVLVIATDSQGEALILVDGTRTQIIARTGVDLKSFDFFKPKMKAGTIVVRGEDSKGNKVIYVKDSGRFRKLLAQGDIIKTDLGPGKVFYKDKDAIIYGAPGIDEKGGVVLQATLTDPNQPSNLLGIGVIKFNKE